MFRLTQMHILVATFLTCILITNKSAATDFNDKFYTLYISGNMEEWVHLLDRAKQTYAKQPTPQLLEEIVRAQYALTAYYLGLNNDDKALQEIDAAAYYLHELEQIYPEQGWVLALDASFQGFKLIISPFRFFFKGPSVLSAVHKCQELSPNHEDVLFLVANQTFYLPSILGGNQQKGLDYFSTLEKKLLQYPIKEDKHWFYLLYLTSNAIACNAAHQYNDAVRIYRQILSIEPHYLWVKNELLPQSLKKQENNYLKSQKEKVQ